MEKTTRKALHRGLRALLSEDGAAAPVEKPPAGTAAGGAEDAPFSYIPLSQITPNPFQPRVKFDAEEMEELKGSIRQHGVITPVIVRRSKGAFELISGERRFRAVQGLGYDTIPAVVRDKVSDRVMKVLGLVDNQQRANLNDIEIASAYQGLIETEEYTHEKLAQDTGKSRPFITNTLRLLKLPENMRAALEEKKISAGHARALLSLEDPAEREKLFARIVRKGLSVRQAEEIVSNKSGARKAKARSAEKSYDLAELENGLCRLLGTRVEIRMAGKRGKIIAAFKDVADLNRIVSLIKKE
jgi:ParB family chromosome partitioning protein